MKNFNIFSLVDYLTEEQTRMVVETLSFFYNGVTSKHQKRIRLVCLSGVRSKNMLIQILDEYKMKDIIRIVDTGEEEQVIEEYKNANLLFFPVESAVGELVPESLAFATPVLCYESDDMRECLDSSCAVFVEKHSFFEDMKAFVDMIESLYFDPHALTFLRNSALNKFKSLFGEKHYQNLEVVA